MVEAHYGWPVFYHVGDQNAPTYLDLGLTLLALGEEARVELSAFSLDGHDGKPLRQLQHRLQRLGCAAEVLAPEAAALVLPELHRVSAAWTARRGHQAEPGDGSPDEATWIAGPVALVRQQQRVVAFARLIGGGRHELAAAVVRHLPDAPDQALDYLLVESMLWAQREGYAWFNLGTVPAEDYPDRRLRPVASRTGAAWFCQGEQFHGLRGLRQHHERFAPVWRPCYLAVPGGLALPRILDDVARLVLCGADGDLHPSATDGAGGKGEG
jgi:phosphatidylglycerol lysyltransferase